MPIRFLGIRVSFCRRVLVLVIVILYFGILLLASRLVGRKGGNDAFFCGNRQSSWPIVAFGMIGASISGLSFIGVPGWVMSTDMTYMQMCFGFFFGYLLVAFVLLPLYYKYRLTSIYTYLYQRFGTISYKTGASFFIISKLLGAAAKFYIVCAILQTCLSDVVVLPYAAVVILTLLLIWLYTRKEGIRTLVWTDALQTFCLLSSLILMLLQVSNMLGMNLSEAMTAVWHDPHSRMFDFGDFSSKQNFWKQFLSGIFVVVVMTGLDQDMMQKNLTCRDLRSAQKDMCSYGILFAPVNFLLLALGILLMLLYQKQGMPLPNKGDNLLSDIVLSGTMGTSCLIFFTIGVIASAFSSADSAMTALTTSVCIDILGKQHDEKMRKVVHFCVFFALAIVTLAFNALGSGSVMDMIYTLVSYTYGPLLGLFAFGMFTHRKLKERFVPFIAIASPILCYMIDLFVYRTTGYRFGYEMLMFNGLLTFVGLLSVSRR